VSAFELTADERETQCPARANHPKLRHVLGVAFPQTNPVGPPEGELERRFLQLAYATACLSCLGTEVSGYLAVLSRETRDYVQQLRTRYEVGDAVHIVFTSLLVADMTRLTEAADAASRGGDPSIANPVAFEIAADALRREIAVREPEVVEYTSQWSMPFGVHWDYYGRRRLADAGLDSDNPSCPRLF
jgi:hypothetical protein